MCVNTVATHTQSTRSRRIPRIFSTCLLVNLSSFTDSSEKRILPQLGDGAGNRLVVVFQSILSVAWPTLVSRQSLYKASFAVCVLFFWGVSLRRDLEGAAFDDRPSF